MVASDKGRSAGGGDQEQRQQLAMGFDAKDLENGDEEDACSDRDSANDSSGSGSDDEDARSATESDAEDDGSDGDSDERVTEEERLIDADLAALAAARPGETVVFRSLSAQLQAAAQAAADIAAASAAATAASAATTNAPGGSSGSSSTAAAARQALIAVANAAAVQGATKYTSVSLVSARLVVFFVYAICEAVRTRDPPLIKDALQALHTHVLAPALTGVPLASGSCVPTATTPSMAMAMAGINAQADAPAAPALAAESAGQAAGQACGRFRGKDLAHGSLSLAQVEALAATNTFFASLAAVRAAADATAAAAAAAGAASSAASAPTAATWAQRRQAERELARERQPALFALPNKRQQALQRNTLVRLRHVWAFVAKTLLRLPLARSTTANAATAAALNSISVAPQAAAASSGSQAQAQQPAVPAPGSSSSSSSGGSATEAGVRALALAARAPVVTYTARVPDEWPGPWSAPRETSTVRSMLCIHVHTCVSPLPDMLP
jgi:hypothetical protein